MGEGTDRVNYDRACRLVDGLEFPTAIFSSDATRFALVSELIQNRGIANRSYALGCFDEPYLNFPEDLLFIKVLQPLREIGRTAVELILGRLEGSLAAGTPNLPTRIMLPPRDFNDGATDPARDRSSLEPSLRPPFLAVEKLL